MDILYPVSVHVWVLYVNPLLESIMGNRGIRLQQDGTSKPVPQGVMALALYSAIRLDLPCTKTDGHPSGLFVQ